MEVQRAPADAVVTLIIARPVKGKQGGMEVLIHSEDSNMHNNHLYAHAAVELTGVCPVCSQECSTGGYANA